MIPKRQWKSIVQATLGDMIENDHWVTKGWEPTGFVEIENTLTAGDMRYTQLPPCPNHCNRLVELRPWCYYHGESYVMIDHPNGGGRERIFYVRWRSEPYGFLFGKCLVCNLVPFIFFPSEQATFFYMTQIGRESCIEL